MSKFKSMTALIKDFKSQPTSTSSKDHEHRIESLVRHIELLPKIGKALSPKKKFYIYVYLNTLKPGKFSYRMRTGKLVIYNYEPIYVGKGSKRRMYSHLKEARRVLNKRRQGINVKASYKTNALVSMLEKDHTPIILKSGKVKESHAFAGEIIYIDGIKRYSKREGPLTNLTDGGDGVTGMEHNKKNAPVQNQLLTVDGTTRTLKEWSKITGIVTGVMQTRIKNGAQPHRVIEKGIVKAKAATYTAFGLTLTITEWSRRTSLTRKCITKRLRRGLTIEEAIDPEHYEEDTINYQGKNLTVVEWARLIGVDPATIHARIKRGLLIEKALSSEHQKNQITITYNGKTRSIAEWSNLLGIKHATIYARMRKGYTLEDVLAPI